MEEWRDIKGYEGLYQVSNLGRVKSLERVVKHPKSGSLTLRGKILKQNLNKKTGYYQVALSKKGKERTKTIHVLVAIAFLDHIPNGLVIVPDHIDDDKTNNRTDNLRLITQRENMRPSESATGEHNIRMTQEGHFRVSFYFKGPYTTVGTYKTIEEAIIVRDEKLAEVEAGTFVPRPKHVPTSKYCCVSWNKAAQKWVVKVKRKFLGYFSDEEEAHQAVLKYKALMVKPGIF